MACKFYTKGDCCQPKKCVSVSLDLVHVGLTASYFVKLLHAIAHWLIYKLGLM